MIFASSLIINLGNGEFNIQELPRSVQLGPINAIVIEDVNQDGNLDIIAAGNDHASETTYGWHDASLGVCLLGNGKNQFRSLSAKESGLYLNKDVKSIKSLRLNSGENILLLGVNSGRLLSYERN